MKVTVLSWMTKVRERTFMLVLHHLTGALDYDSLDDFCLVPSKSDGPQSAAKLKKENESLKSKLEAMERQMASVQKQIVARNEQDQHLRDNIMLARKEVWITVS